MRRLSSISHAAQCSMACEQIDTVVHLAADPSPEADFHDSLLENNFQGTYNVLEPPRMPAAGG